MKALAKPTFEGFRGYDLKALYQLRSSLQKFEFGTLWMIILHAAIFQQSSAFSVLYIKLSFVSRLAAYSIDFANANAKHNLKPQTVTLPSWLVFHHSGVFGMHLFSAFFLTPKEPLEIFVWALCSQSSHNTWTKKFSLPLYWGNVLLGVLSGSYYACILYDGEARYPAILFLASLVVAMVGIALLLEQNFGRRGGGKSLRPERKMMIGWEKISPHLSNSRKNY